MNAVKQSRALLTQKLDELSTRERRLVIGGSIVLLVTLVWSILIAPAWQTITTGPALQVAMMDKAAQVMRAARELNQLRAVRSQVQVKPTDIQNRLNSLIAQANLSKTTVVGRNEEGEYTVTFTKAPAASVLAWLASVQSISTLKPVEGELDKPEAATLSGTLTFSVAEPGGQRSR